MRSSLLGIRSEAQRRTFVEQLVESIRRIQYIAVIQKRKLGSKLADPSRDIFDPLKASIIFRRRGWLDEACWMVFLSVYFGKHRHAGWRYAREVYSGRGSGAKWTWKRTSGNPGAFRKWIAHYRRFITRVGSPHGFGNHRKYETFNSRSSRGTGAAITSYVAWIGSHRSHRRFFEQTKRIAGVKPAKMFDYLFHSMACVASFGRTARFDYLTMLGKLGLVSLQPGLPYLHGATGPYEGAKLLFGRKKYLGQDRTKLDNAVAKLGRHLGVGMQVMEDALCNWQKSPRTFKAFRG